MHNPPLPIPSKEIRLGDEEGALDKFLVHMRWLDPTFAMHTFLVSSTPIGSRPGSFVLEPRYINETNLSELQDVAERFYDQRCAHLEGMQTILILKGDFPLSSRTKSRYQVSMIAASANRLWHFSAEQTLKAIDDAKCIPPQTDYACVDSWRMFRYLDAPRWSFDRLGSYSRGDFEEKEEDYFMRMLRGTEAFHNDPKLYYSASVHDRLFQSLRFEFFDWIKDGYDDCDGIAARSLGRVKRSRDFLLNRFEYVGQWLDHGRRTLSPKILALRAQFVGQENPAGDPTPMLESEIMALKIASIVTSGAHIPWPIPREYYADVVELLLRKIAGYRIETIQAFKPVNLKRSILGASDANIH